MGKAIHIGCCGWGYLREKEFQEKIKREYRSKLQAYAQLYDCVEVNSTFYRTPKLSTAEKWRLESSEVNEVFEFTVKVSQLITHRDRFSKASVDVFEQMTGVCRALKAKVLLFQSPASFAATKANIEKLKTFFGKIGPSDLVFVWEPRGTWYDDPAVIEEVCRTCDLVHCVDPLRNEPLHAGKKKMIYFRLHGFGRPSMYRYDFSRDDLRRIKEQCDGLGGDVRDVYVFFNNVFCYENGLEFLEMVG